MNIFYKILKSKTVLYLFSLLLIISSCDSDEPDKTNELRLLKVEVNGETLKEPRNNVDTEAGIELVFSHPLNKSAFESAFRLTSSGDPLNYTFAYSNSNSFVSINIEDRLGYETDYTLSIDEGVLGEAGQQLEEPLVYNFTTSKFVPSAVSLSSDKSSSLEGESVIITATLNQISTANVSFDLAFSGTASADDYTVPSENVVISAGEKSATITLTTINDGIPEGEETIIIGIENLVNGAEGSPKQILISLNDELPALALKGVMAIRWTGETDGSSGKALHLIAVEDIPDLSIYGIGVANNGGGTDGVEYEFPVMSVAAGEQILLARDEAALSSYFGSCYTQFDHVLQTDEMSQNGDDAIELFKGTNIIETYGDADVDGTGMEWDYTGSWAYKLKDEWIYGGVDCAASSTTTQDADCVYPLCGEPLRLQGIMALTWDGSGTNGGKAVQLRAYKDIADLSQYAIGVANNGGGTDGPEFTLPNIAVGEGDHILVARELNTLSSYFGSCYDKFDETVETDAMNQNGDDAIELFSGADVIETYGDADVDGTGQLWDYAGSWAYKVNSTWVYGGVDCAATSTTTQMSSCTYTFCE